MFPNDLNNKAKSLLQTCREVGLRIVTAESCTGGLIAGCLTGIAGSSAVFERGFVTYSNESKAEILGVPAELIAEHGAVSEPVARAMAAGALERSRAELVVAVTGIAGPGGGSPGHPVGLVHFAGGRGDQGIVHAREIFAGDRDEVRLATVHKALDMLDDLARRTFDV
ncbi:MAG: CinA family protein [Alphaproteobacteria bacterium]